jgi:hypothetical protein
MRIRFYRYITVGLAGFVSTVCAAESTAVSSPAAGAADVAKNYVQKLEQGQIDEALKLWDSRAANDKLKSRFERQAAKVKGFGGVEKVDVRTCEERRIQKYEKQTGEKVDIVPVEISCRDGNLLLAVFSIRKMDGQYKIFLLDSLKEWGGTASLDEELPYKG